MIFVRDIFFWAVVGAIVGFFIGKAKGLPREGFMLGLIFGPIGWGILIMLPNVKPPKPAGLKCPRCERPVLREDKACPHCGNILVDVSYRVEDGGDADPK